MEKIKTWVSLWQPTGTYLDRQWTVFLQVMVNWQQASPAPRVLTESLHLGPSSKWVSFVPRNQTLQSYTPVPRFISCNSVLALSVHTDAWQNNCICILSTLQLLSLISARDSTFCGLKWSISKNQQNSVVVSGNKRNQPLFPLWQTLTHIVISQCINIEISKLQVWSRLSWNVGSRIKKIHSTAASDSNKPK